MNLTQKRAWEIDLSSFVFAVICVLAISVTCFALYAGADDRIEYTGKITAVTPYVEQYVSADNDTDKIQTAKSISEYLRLNPINPSSSGYAEFAASVDSLMFDAAKIYLSTFSTDLKMYESKQIIGWVENFINDCVLPSSQPGYYAVLSDYSAKKHACEEKYSALKDSLEKASPLGEREYDVIYANNSFDQQSNALGMTNATTSGITCGIKSEKNGNKYFSADSRGYNTNTSPTWSGL